MAEQDMPRWNEENPDQRDVPSHESRGRGSYGPLLVAKTAKRPSSAQMSVAASAFISILTVAVLFGPRKVPTAQADPQINSGGPVNVGLPNSLSRAERPAIQLSRDLVSNDPSLDIDPSVYAGVTADRTYPVPKLEKVRLGVTSSGALALSEAPNFSARIGDRFASLTTSNNYVFYTLDSSLQQFVEGVVGRAQANHVAIVAMNPKTGAILAIAGKSTGTSKSPAIQDIEYHAGFPAASLFKVVTAAAAVEEAGIDADSMIKFRGGTYTLNESNYLPNPRKDLRVMSVAEALGRSCNPVFGQLGFRYLNGTILTKYARLFGFNRYLGLEVPLAPSGAEIPFTDRYELSRTSAGFGEVRISPIHAAALVSGIANGGLLPRPQMIERVVSPDGVVVQRPRPEVLQRIVRPTTAATLMEMMRYTTTMGTSRKEFMVGNRPRLTGLDVAGKTGTLSGTDPVGLNNWFIGVAPVANPELAIAVITVDPRYSSKASALARKVFEKYFNITPLAYEPTYTKTKTKVRTPTRSKTKSPAYRTVVTKKKPKAKVIKAPKAKRK